MARIRGTASDDILGGSDRRDTILGFGGDDTMIGRGGDDTLDGGDGDDYLVGWSGADELIGGAGADVFAVHSIYAMGAVWGWSFSPDRAGERDTITDWNPAEGDKIDLSGLIKNIDTDGDGKSERYAVTWSDVEIETIGADEYRVHVQQVAGDPQWDLGIDVIGTAPTEADFIF